MDYYDAKAESKLFGERFRELRRLKGLTQEDVANRTGLAVSTISRLERGAFTIGVNKLPLLADALGVPVRNLYKELGY